jgi:thiol-disulfide isomerase/thioredoxin
VQHGRLSKALEQLKGNPIQTVQSPWQKESGTVVDLVGQIFSTTVLDDTKDVIVLVYASWCGHCKKVMPVWDKLAGLVRGVSTLLVARMDHTENDVPQTKYAVEKYPTIYLAPAYNKDAPREYTSDDRDVVSLLKWLIANVDIPFDAWDGETFPVA